MSGVEVAETEVRRRAVVRRPARREQVLGLLRAHEPELRRAFSVRSLALFGSLARGEAGAASDVDLLVEFDRPIGLLHLVGTAQRIEDILGRRVDLVLRRALLPQLRDRVLGEAELVF
jgi:predicted nucleotidyltransferase